MAKGEDASQPSLVELDRQWRAIADEGEREAFYDERVFPKVLDTVVARERKRLGLGGGDSVYPVMMLTLGTSPWPLVLSLCVWRPQKALLLATQDSVSLVDWVRKRLSWPLQLEWRIVDKVNPLHIYREMKDAYLRWGKPREGAVDVTGGTKAMAAGATQGSGILGYDVVYVESDYNPQLRRPVPGSERIARLANPLQVMGDLERGRALTLAERGEYRGAATVLQGLAEKVPGDGSILCEALARLASAYAAWDSLDLERAQEELAAFRGRLRQHGQPGGVAELAAWAEKGAVLDVLDRQERTVTLLKEGLPKKAKAIPLERLREKEFVSPLLGVIYQMAKRREGEGRLDMAALLWYRILEMVEQCRLAVFNLDTAAPDYAALAEAAGRTEEEISLGYSAKRRETGYPESHLPAPVALVDGYLLLDALGEGLCANLKQLAHLVGLRNFSIYGHGYSFISRRDYDDFRGLADRVLAEFTERTGIDRGEWEELAFVPLG